MKHKIENHNLNKPRYYWLFISRVKWRIWFLILAIGYALQVFSLIIFPIALIAWVLGLSDNYIEDYINYTKRVLYTT